MEFNKKGNDVLKNCLMFTKVKVLTCKLINSEWTKFYVCHDTFWRHKPFQIFNFCQSFVNFPILIQKNWFCHWKFERLRQKLAHLSVCQNIHLVAPSAKMSPLTIDFIWCAENIILFFIVFELCNIKEYF